MKNLFLCFFILMATSVVVMADTITFEATVNSSIVSLNESLQLTLTFTGVNQGLDPINLPAIDGFSTQYLGPSTSVTIVNGDYHSEKSFNYNLFPNKVGRFQIPAISATIAGQTYMTKPINVEVVANSAQVQTQNQVPTSSGTSDQTQAPSAESLNDKISVIASVDNTNVYLNERVPLTIKLLINGIPMSDVQMPQFEKQGFSIDDFQKPQQYSQVLNGVQYDVVEFKTYIYPNQLGDLQIGPVQITGNVLYKSGNDNPFGQEMSPFGGDIFKNFFNSETTRPLTESSQPIQIHVSSLPQDDRPQDFSGAIGQFDFQASVSPSQVKAGDPMTLKMDLRGSGNFKNVQMPVFQGLGFKTYDPQIKDGVDEKTAEQVIIPTSVGTKAVPALRFSYFDPSAKAYKTIVQGPFAIQVTPPSPEQEFKAVNFSNIAQETSTLSGTQFSIGKILNKIHKKVTILFRSIWFWTIWGIIVAGTISFYIWRRFQYRLEHDRAFARRLKAAREAKEALRQAQEYISAGKSKDFYALLSKILHDYLANRWNMSSAALSNEEILGHLKTAQIDVTYIAQIKTILEQSDLVRFASVGRDAGQMRLDLDQAKDLIDHLENHLK